MAGEPSISDWHVVTCEAAKHDPDVIDFCSRVFDASQVLDDLVDGDNPVSAEDVCRVFWSLLIEVPSNPFFQKHRVELTALLRLVLNDWFDSVLLERSRERGDLVVAYGLRLQSSRFLIQIAGMVGGYTHMREISLKVTEMGFRETLDEYMEGAWAPEA